MLRCAERPAQGIPLRLCFNVTESVPEALHRRGPSASLGAGPPEWQNAWVYGLAEGAGTLTVARGAENDIVISIDHVTRRFGAFVAVDDAHFDIRRAEFFSMLGPSGCGKTTTLRMIAGFEQPSEGEIRLEGSDVSKVPPYKRNVNTVFQQYALFPHMSVKDNVAFGLKAKKVGKAEIEKRVADLLEIVRLGDFAARKPSQLSGGQQQRVALAPRW